MITPVKFEIAKLLKEKGWNKPTLHFFFEDGVLIENSYEDTVGMDYGSPFEVEFSELTDNWNNGWVKKKDGSMCFGCDKSKGYLDIYSAPIISEVVMWLYEKHGIWISIIDTNPNQTKWEYQISKKDEGLLHSCGQYPATYYNSPTEAYQDSIDYVLKNLI